jgi:hypothetical protein
MRLFDHTSIHAIISPVSLKTPQDPFPPNNPDKVNPENHILPAYEQAPFPQVSGQ